MTPRHGDVLLSDGVAAVWGPRRLLYACAGALLSVGAPVGLLAVRWAAGAQRRDRAFSCRTVSDLLAADPAGYLYVGAATAGAFSLFGYVLGRQADRLASLAETDALTGLVNTRGLAERIARELTWAQQHRQPLALLLVDLDGLKAINDSYGHHAGDRAIRRLASVIRSQLPGTQRRRRL